MISEQSEDLSVPLFEQCSASMLYDPVCVFIFAVPFFGQPDNQIRVCFGNIIQIIGNTLPHVQGRICFQPLQYGQYRRRILFVFGQGLTPRQLRPAAFAGQSADMFIFMPGPGVHLCHHTLLLADDKRPYGKFGS